MEPKRQREIAIGVIAALAVSVAAYRISSTPSASASSGQPSALTTELPSSHQSSQKGVINLNLEALKAPKADPAQSMRNPFRFKPKPPPPPPAPSPSMAMSAVPAEPPPPPRIPLKFIGQFESTTTGRIAILSDGRGVYRGREGETIEGRYRIVRIGVESIEMEYLDGRGRQTIRQTGQ